MGKYKIIKISILSSVLLIISVFTFVSLGSGNTTVGSTEDPLVTLSYVEQRLEQFNEHVSNQIEEVRTSNVGTVVATPATESSNSLFVVVQVETGHKMTFGNSTEVILRTGDATAIISIDGGLSDLTDGLDLKQDDVIPKNHHLLIPKDDGRGFVTSSEVWVMVKGTYIVEKL